MNNLWVYIVLIQIQLDFLSIYFYKHNQYNIFLVAFQRNQISIQYNILLNFLARKEMQNEAHIPF